MANRYRNLIYSTAEYTRVYNDFRGIELSGSATSSSPSRLAYAKNVYKDYGGNGARVLESVPGFRCFAHHKEKVHSLFYQRSVFGGEDHVIAHVGNKLIRHPVSDFNGENKAGEVIATVENTKSFGFEFGRYFYVMDTKKILQISDSGECKTVGDSDSYPYVPTTFISGEPYEQRNLLVRDFKEEYFISEPGAYLYSTLGVKLQITDPYNRFCSVIGTSSNTEEIYIPSYASIGGIEYKVTSVDDSAFRGNTDITAVYIPEGISSIGSRAFSGCSALVTVVLPATVTDIGSEAFSGCSRLKTVYLGAGLSTIGEGAFSDCPLLGTVNYALNESELLKIEGKDQLGARSIAYKSVYEAIKISLPLHDRVEGITSVTLSGETVDYDTTDDGEVFKSVILSLPDAKSATEVKIVIKGKLAPLGPEWSKDMTENEDITPYQAIVGCTIGEVFDGRIFFCGNPSFPNTVFYTERVKPGQESALYVGRYNYFNDGVGSHPVGAMLAVRDMLAVFKKSDDGSGSIFYHKKEATSHEIIDTVYPVAYVHSGICSLGRAFTFLDDPVFLSKDGVMALDRENINYQRNVVCRSHNVNYALLKENLTNASLCEWLGYLVVGINGKIFLADSRAMFTHPAGSMEYEWFLLEDIGAYTGDSTVYRYSPDAYSDAVAHPTLAGSVARSEEVFSQADETGKLYYYVLSDGVKYRVIPTEERDGGVYHPASVFISFGQRLLFATDDGHLCVFNNDMRGIAPTSVTEKEDYNEEEYLAYMGDKLHPLFYSFAGHAPTYVIKTALDDCGVPHLTKNTVKASLVVKAESHLNEAIFCEVATDTGEPIGVGSFPAVGATFDDFDFENPIWRVPHYASTTLAEKEKRWIEKQIILSARSFASPISVYSISYRYVIKGKIKNNVK